MTLQDLIKTLESCDPQQAVPFGFGSGHTDRGYYEDLAFAPRRDTTVGAMLQEARACLGVVMTGYKGGEYLMAGWTTCRIGRWGECGDEIGHILLAYMLGQDIGKTGLFVGEP